jgi:hypothetical protein
MGRRQVHFLAESVFIPRESVSERRLATNSCQFLVPSSQLEIRVAQRLKSGSQ